MNSLEILAERAARQRDRTPSLSNVVTVAQASRRPVVRLRCRLPWFDLMLGGGFVRGSVVMVHGEPGAGKSTALMQAVANVRSSLYISAEEDLTAVAARAMRLKLRDDLALLACDNIHGALAVAGSTALVVVDSVQTMKPNAREATRLAVEHARQNNVCVVLVCHENKDGAHSGPRTIEHLVDVSIKIQRFPRSIITVKNRFGPADIVLPLVMTETGLRLDHP